MLIVHAGNRIDAPGRAQDRFPADRVESVRSRVRLLLRTLQPALLISNAAAGADLIVLQEAQALGIAVRAVLPIARDEFVRQSVVDNGPQWVAAFDEVMSHAETDPSSDVVHDRLRATDEWYEAANTALLNTALQAAAETAPPMPVLALTIRPIPTLGEASITDHFAKLAEQAGLLVLTLDPISATDPVLVSTPRHSGPRHSAR